MRNDGFTQMNLGEGLLLVMLHLIWAREDLLLC